MDDGWIYQEELDRFSCVCSEQVLADLEEFGGCGEKTKGANFFREDVVITEGR